MFWIAKGFETWDSKHSELLKDLRHETQNIQLEAAIQIHVSNIDFVVGQTWMQVLKLPSPDHMNIQKVVLVSSSIKRD